MKEQSLEDILAAVRLTELIGQLKADELEELVSTKASRLKKNIQLHTDGRKAAGKRRARLNYQKRWMRAKRLKVLQAIPTEGWHTYFMMSRHPWHIGKEEWEEHVEPCLGDGWIGVHRYDGKKPYTLDNIYILDEEATVFDGKEWSLRQAGFSK